MLIKKMLKLLDGATIPRDDLRRLPLAHCTSLRDVARRHVIWRLSPSYCFLVHLLYSVKMRADILIPEGMFEVSEHLALHYCNPRQLRLLTACLVDICA